MVGVKGAAKLIQKGEVVAIPTETAYGLAARAFEESSVKKIYDIKGRSGNKKLPILVNSLEQLRGHAYLSNLGKYLSKHLHPGPLNLTINSHHPWVGAFRISELKLARDLVGMVGPVTATSANKSGKPNKFDPKKIKLKVPIMGTKKLKKGKTSTVYDPRKLTIIREGAVPQNRINQYVVAYHILQKIKPTPKKEKEIIKVADEVLAKIKKTHKKALIGGSVAKRTFTNDASDIDIFLIFNTSEDLNEKVDYLKKIAKFGKDIRTEFSQHPYVKTNYKGFEIELVPAYDTKPPKILSATDRSRWHVEFVSKFSEELKDEVRILKKFFKGIEVYGADSKVEGFSAYSMEVLIGKHKSFVKTLEWLKQSKYPIKLSDPVHKKRNVLASVSRNAHHIAKTAAVEYLKSPGQNFFFPQLPTPLKNLPKKGLAIIEFDRPIDFVEDAVWGNTRRKLKKLARNGNRDGFEVTNWSLNVDKGVYGIMRYNSKEYIIRKGPPKLKRSEVERFKKRNKWFEKNGMLYSKKKRRFKTLRDFVNYFEIAKVHTGESLKKVYNKMSKDEKLWVRKFLESKKSWEY